MMGSLLPQRQKTQEIISNYMAVDSIDSDAYIVIYSVWLEIRMAIYTVEFPRNQGLKCKISYVDW